MRLLRELIGIIKLLPLYVTLDSAPLHIALSLNKKVIAIFGPTDEKKYGPLAEKRKVIKPEKTCRPCEKALCAIGPDEGCIIEVTVDAVFEAAKELLK